MCTFLHASNPPVFWHSCHFKPDRVSFSTPEAEAETMAYFLVSILPFLSRRTVKTFISCYRNTRTPGGSLQGFRRVSERGLWRGLWRVFEGFLKGSAEGPFKALSKRLQEPFKNPLQGVETDNALGFPGLKKSVPGSGAPVAGNESLERTATEWGFAIGTMGFALIFLCGLGQFFDEHKPTDKKLTPILVWMTINHYTPTSWEYVPQKIPTELLMLLPRQGLPGEPKQISPVCKALYAEVSKLWANLSGSSQ